MSHNVTFAAARFTDIDRLKDAFAKLGWTVIDNATIRTYQDAARHTRYPHVAVNPTGPEACHYDVGLTMNDVHEWVMTGDFSMSNIHEQLSGDKHQFEKLRIAYRESEVQQIAMSRNGSITQSEQLADGTIIGEMEIEVEV
jgi:hypothetical protein